MAGKSRTHSEDWWANNASPAVLRCSGHYKSTGEQCRRVAEDGAVVCDQHGAAAGQVRRRAAERIAVTADDAAQKLAAWMDDSSVPFQVRAKIAQDLLDRAGLGAAQVHKIMPITEDPVEALFRSILDGPEALLAPVSPPLTLPAEPRPEDNTEAVLAELVGPPEPVAAPTQQAARENPPARNPTVPPAAHPRRVGVALDRTCVVTGAATRGARPPSSGVSRRFFNQFSESIRLMATTRKPSRSQTG